jgi:hypothetical protein
MDADYPLDDAVPGLLPVAEIVNQPRRRKIGSSRASRDPGTPSLASHLKGKSDD